MKLSQQTHNGLKIVYELGKEHPNELSATRLSEKLYLSPKYLEKILRPLSKAGIVHASRGVLGGYALSTAPAELTVGEVVRALEDDMEIVGCVKTPCPNCPTSGVWKRLYDGINGVLDSITVEQMIDEHRSANHTCKKEENHGTHLSGSCCNHQA